MVYSHSLSLPLERTALYPCLYIAASLETASRCEGRKELTNATASILCEGEPVGADEGAQVGGDSMREFLEFFTGRVAGQFIAGCRSIRSDCNDRPVARVAGGRIREYVERLLR